MSTPTDTAVALLPPLPGSLPSEAEFKTWLDKQSEGVEWKDGYWLEAHEKFDGVPDFGDSFCGECVQKQRWIERHRKSPYTQIRAYYDRPDSDSMKECDRCGCLLNHAATEYMIEEEIRHYREDHKGPLSASDAAVMANMMEGFGHWDSARDWPLLAPIGARLMAENAKDMGRATDSEST